jgi:hypothetical protein
VTMPGLALDIPLPPYLADTFGYPGQARYVAFYRTPAGDDLVYDDGRISAAGAAGAFLAYCRHPAVAPLLSVWDLGSSGEEARHCLLIDRIDPLVTVAPLAEARAIDTYNAA